MSDEEIELNWRIGHTLKWLIDKYQEKENERRKKRGEGKVDKEEARKYVTTIVYNYQTAIMRGDRTWK